MQHVFPSPEKSKQTAGASVRKPGLIHRIAAKTSLPGNYLGYRERKAPGLFAEGFYKYSVLSASLHISNHHLKNLLLAQRFIFALERLL